MRVLLRSLLASGFALTGLGSMVGEVVINEIHYDPDIETELVEFIELHNPGAAAVDVGGWSLGNAVEYRFAAGTIIPAGGFLVVAANPAALRAKFGVTAAGPWMGLLANEGETIELRNGEGGLEDGVDYQLGFPWPTVGDPPGYSIELIRPDLSNSIGGHWRASVVGNASQQTIEWVGRGSSWRYFKGLSEASTPSTVWRQAGFDDGGWEEGGAPVGYDASLPMATPLSDMAGAYTTFFLRRTFVVEDPAVITALTLEVLFDDGFKLWINGTNVINVNMDAGEVAYDQPSTGGARESNAYDSYALNNPRAYLRAGTNVIAVQVANVLLSGSSDCFFDARLLGLVGPTGRGPTPGALNSVSGTPVPPAIRQVEHAPRTPRPEEAVTITAHVTDADGMGAVRLLYQLVDPGSYIELTDAAYTNNWTTAVMQDDGTAGDAYAGDSVYTAVLPVSVQRQRRLVRYRLVAEDAGGRAVSAPYADDPQPNFAYYVDEGVPAWTGAVRPGDTGSLGQPFTVSSNAMNRLPVIRLLGRRETIEESTWLSRYGGDAYPWLGTLVYDGLVYDHIRHRARGGVWRYAMVKNMWKFDFNRGHDFQMRNNWGGHFKTRWRKLNLGASIQQGDYNHRGEQGMFESVGLRLFQLAGVESPHTVFVQLRVVDEANEVNPSSQYEGDFWGVYLATEQEDGRFLEEHGLPDANLYKMEGGTGELNNLGPAGPTDKSDLNAFLSGYNNAADAWWATNLNLRAYFSYQTIVQGIHHYDICYDKNYFYYRHPATGRWQVTPWDLDLTWAENMYDAGCGGVDRIKQRLIPNPSARPAMYVAWQNRIRELRDLLFNEDEAGRLIEEYAGRLRGPTNAPSVLDADRAQWDYNPRMTDSRYSSALSKAGQGRFYRWPGEPFATKDFAGCVQLMKRYVGFRSTNTGANPLALDEIAADSAIPSTPSITYVGPGGYPVNRLRFRASPYSGGSGFASMQWRVGEITRPTAPSWGSSEPWVYEIEAVWETAELGAYASEMDVPSGVLKPGRVYRARVRMTDTSGRASHWSPPGEFVAGEPDNAAAMLDYLRVTELMSAPAGDAEMEFVELRNISTNLALNLEGAKFTAGIDYTFPAGTTVAPGGYVVVIKTADPVAFRARYGVDGAARLFGPYGGSLDNGGEEVVLKTASGGTEIVSFQYGDGQGWPVAVQEGGHSLVPLDRALGGQATGALDYPGNWRASGGIGGSPGRADPAVPSAEVRLNEIVAHTDYVDPQRPQYDSNDWIELLNVSGQSMPMAGWFLSDDPRDLRKWPLPSISLAAGARVVFDEISGFHSPITSGFGIDKAGEQILLSHLDGTAQPRVVDAIRFKGQENEVSLGRFPDGGGVRYPLLRTAGSANGPPLPGPVIGEVMYHPWDPSPLNDNTIDEYVELWNPTAAAVALWGTNGGWRLGGGIEFTFPSGTSLAAGGCLLVVSFDPIQTAVLTAFKATYGLTNPAAMIVGPFDRKLGNRSDRVALERPQYPDLPGEPYSWVVVDEVTYGNQDPWPTNANGAGQALHRKVAADDGNDPANWVAAAPTPGERVGSGPGGDSDGDGMPDEWEDGYGLDRLDPGDAIEDADLDGFANRDEYLAGTDPRDAGSVLRIENLEWQSEGVRLQLQVVQGRTYTVQYNAGLAPAGWQRLADLPPQPATGLAEVLDPQTDGARARHYRVVTPVVP